MPVYRIEVPVTGRAIAQPVSDDGDELVFLFSDKEKKLFDLIAKSGDGVLFNSPDFAHLRNLVGSKNLTGIKPSASPGMHAIIFI